MAGARTAAMAAENDLAAEARAEATDCKAHVCGERPLPRDPGHGTAHPHPPRYSARVVPALDAIAELTWKVDDKSICFDVETREGFALEAVRTAACVELRRLSRVHTPEGGAGEASEPEAPERRDFDSLHSLLMAVR